VTDRLAGVEADLLSVHVDFPLFERLAKPVPPGTPSCRAGVNGWISRATVPEKSKNIAAFRATKHQRRRCGAHYSALILLIASD
jgi:hypothetical protein